MISLQVSLQAAFQAFKTRCSMASVFSASDKKTTGWLKPNRLTETLLVAYSRTWGSMMQFSKSLLAVPAATPGSCKGHDYIGWNRWNHWNYEETKRNNSASKLEGWNGLYDYHWLPVAVVFPCGAVLSLTRKLAAAIAMGDDAHIAFGAKGLRKTSKTRLLLVCSALRCKTCPKGRSVHKTYCTWHTAYKVQRIHEGWQTKSPEAASCESTRLPPDNLS